MAKLHRHIGVLYGNFKDSSVKYDNLRELQDLLHGHRKQVKEPTSVRWLSVKTAAKIILECYNSIIMCLENADAKQDPKAYFLLVDVLCVIGILSLTFQKDSVLSLSDIKSSVDNTKETLRL